MDGKRIQNYLSQEVDSILDIYKQFETLIPSNKTRGAAHRGEDGRFIEELLKKCISKYLPKELEVLTGFILRPAVKTDKNNKTRKIDKDKHSTQLDIIIYNTAKYPIFKRFGDNVIVPPEGVIAVISVKKHLKPEDIKKECTALWEVSQLCNNNNIRGPYLSLICMNSNINKKDEIKYILQQIKEAYSAVENSQPTFDDLIGFVGNLNKWSIFKQRPEKQGDRTSSYIYFEHQDNESHLGLQFILTGILSVYYDETRNNIKRLGFTSFPSNRRFDGKFDSIQYSKLR